MLSLNKLNKINKMKKICGRCKGQGGYFIKLRQSLSTPYRFARSDGCLVEHYVSCDMPGCHNGIVDLKENYEIIRGKN